jgi:hypothetical protein
MARIWRMAQWEFWGAPVLAGTSNTRIARLQRILTNVFFVASRGRRKVAGRELTRAVAPLYRNAANGSLGLAFTNSMIRCTVFLKSPF